MSQSKPAPGQSLTGRAQPPAWFRLVGAVGLTAAALGLVAKRGAAVGIIAGVIYGSIGLATLLAWEQTTAWSKGHPLLDSLIIVPLLFLTVAYITNFSVGMCVVISLLAGLLLVGLSAALRSRRASRQ